MFSGLISILINVLAHRGKAAFISGMLVISFLFFSCAEITMNINIVYRSNDAVTGQQMSYRGQAFYSFFSSEYAHDYAAILIYTPGLSGIHFNMEIDDGYADFESGRELTLTNSLPEFRRLAPYYDIAGVYTYLPSVDAGWYTSIANPEEMPRHWLSNGNIVFVSSYPQGYEFSYEDPATGEMIVSDVDMDRMQLYVIENSAPVDTDSLTITVR